jgi:hypothetical protein
VKGRGAALEKTPVPLLPDFGPSKLFQRHAKHFQICGLFLQTFPKIPLAVFWEIKALQGEKGKFRFAPNFCVVGRVSLDGNDASTDERKG